MPARRADNALQQRGKRRGFGLRIVGGQGELHRQRDQKIQRGDNGETQPDRQREVAARVAILLRGEGEHFPSGEGEKNQAGDGERAFPCFGGKGRGDSGAGGMVAEHQRGDGD